MPPMPPMPPMPNVSTSSFSHDIDDDLVVQKTPRGQHIRKTINTYTTPTRTIKAVQQISISTPKSTPKQSIRAKDQPTSAALVSGKEMVKWVPKSALRSIKENIKSRSVELQSPNEQIYLLNRPKVNTKPDDDPLFKFVVTPKASVIRNIDITKPKKALKYHDTEE